MLSLSWSPPLFCGIPLADAAADELVLVAGFAAEELWVTWAEPDEDEPDEALPLLPPQPAIASAAETATPSKVSLTFGNFMCMSISLAFPASLNGGR